MNLIYQKYTNKVVFLLLAFSSFGLSNCKKLVVVDAPVDYINAANIYNTDVNAASVLTGIYTSMSTDNSGSFTGLTSLSVYPALSADELNLFITDGRYIGYWGNGLTSDYSVGNSANYWSNIYPIIFIANSAIEGLTNSNSLTPAVKQQLLGEAKFIRAFCYFYMVNLFGDVPLVLSNDWQVNAALTRSPVTDVYQQIIDDLKDAQALLSINYLMADAITPYASGSIQRVRPTKWAATALLARAYLYVKDYTNAELQATAVINNSSLFGLSALTDVFKMNSTEAIWQLQAVGTAENSNTGDGKLFVLPALGPGGPYPVYLSPNIVNSFEAGDQRKLNWIDSVKPASIAYYYAKKYKIGAVNTPAEEYPMIFRLGEQLLIRAEARAQLNKISEAQADLNAIRLRAGLNSTIANDETTLLTAIIQERRVELFTEWGHRWFDLKRTNTIDAIMGPVCTQKGGAWSPTKSLYPIPLTELQRAPQLVQNIGY